MAKPLRYPREALPGRQRPYRTCPADFRERYLEMGWDGIVEHYATHWRAVARWIDEAGGDELRQARAAHVRQHGKQYLHVEPVDAERRSSGCMSKERPMAHRSAEYARA